MNTSSATHRNNDYADFLIHSGFGWQLYSPDACEPDSGDYIAHHEVMEAVDDLNAALVKVYETVDDAKLGDLRGDLQEFMTRTYNRGMEAAFVKHRRVGANDTEARYVGRTSFRAFAKSRWGIELDGWDLI